MGPGFGGKGKNNKVIIVTNVFAQGHGQELLSFLQNKGADVSFIGNPFFFCKGKKSYFEHYMGTSQIERMEFPFVGRSEVTSYLRDAAATLMFILRARRRYQIYFGLNPMNACLGIMLKRFGIVKQTVFYTIDYVPDRFENKALDTIYRMMDAFAVKFSDRTWNLTEEMGEERRKIGVRGGERQKVVPTGTGFSRLKQCSIDQIDRRTIVFLSHLREGQGIDLIIKALPRIIKENPDLKLKVIGTGPLEKHFKEEVEKQGLSRSIEFLGFIENNSDIENIVSHCALGIAPYVPDPKSFTWFADPGKPKVYLGCGIPVIICKVPPVYKLIESKRAGIAIDYDPDQLAEAISRLFKNDALYREVRENAEKLGRDYDWDMIYDSAFKDLG